MRSESWGKTMQIDGEIRKKIQIVAAAMTVIFAFGTAAHANIKVRPSSVSFGSQSVGSTSASHKVTLTNDERRSITISSVSDSAAQFSYSGPTLPVNLSPGESLTGSVTFKPSAAKAYIPAHWNSSDSNGSTISIALSGTGTGQAATPPTQQQRLRQQSHRSRRARSNVGQTATFNVAATGVRRL